VAVRALVFRPHGTFRDIQSVPHPPPMKHSRDTARSSQVWRQKQFKFAWLPPK
jgi:hypothetical protein